MESFDEVLIHDFEKVKEVIGGIRTIRLQKNIAQKETLALEATGENPVAAFNSILTKMGNLSAINTVSVKAEGAAAFMVVEEIRSRLEISGRIPAKRPEETQQRKIRKQGSCQRYRNGTQEASRCRNKDCRFERKHRRTEKVKHTYI